LISEKYDIPLNDLLSTASSSTKKSSVRRSVRGSNKGTPEVLKEKIEESKAQGKFFNVSSGRPLADTQANRKKYCFNDDLFIAGVSLTEQKFVNAVALLTNEKEKIEEKIVKPEEKEEKIIEELEEKIIEEPVEKVDEELEEKIIEEPVEKVDEELEEKIIEEPVEKVDEEKEESDTENVVKLSALIEKTEIKNSKKRMQTHYDAKIKGYIEKETNFILLRKGINYVVGKEKIGDGGERIPLDAYDLENCKKWGWATF